MMQLDIKKVKNTVTKKLARAFKKQERKGPPHKNDLDQDPDTIYYELPITNDNDENQTVSNNNEYDDLPPGIRPFAIKPEGVHIDWDAANNVSRIDPERQWYRTDNEPSIWDEEDVLDLIADELIMSDQEQQRPISSLLVGEFDPKNFLEQVPTEDTSGNQLPPWKRMLMAKQVAEKAYHDAEETKKRMAEDARYAEMPLWKREIIRKKELERNSSQAS